MDNLLELYKDIDTRDYVGIKKYKNGKHALFVVLLEHLETGHRLIKKRYRKEHYDIFVNECLTLAKLSDCDFVPKLYKIRPDSRTIYMSYCGKPIDEDGFIKYRSTIKEYKNLLKDRWDIYHNDIKAGNVCLLKNKIYFIDFGWAHNKKVKAGYQQN